MSLDPPYTIVVSVDFGSRNLTPPFFSLPYRLQLGTSLYSFCALDSLCFSLEGPLVLSIGFSLRVGQILLLYDSDFGPHLSPSGDSFLRVFIILLL